MVNKLVNKKLKAFTLIEVVVYMALFALIFVMIIEFSISIRQINSSTNTSTRLDNAMIFANQVLETNLSNIQTVVSINSAFDSDNGVLNAILKNGETVEFKIAQNRLVITKGTTTSPITPVEVFVNKFNITPVYTSDTTLTNIIGIKINLSIYVENNSEPRKDRTITNSFYILGD